MANGTRSRRKTGPQIGREYIGLNHEPLTWEEQKRWSLLERSEALRESRDRMHDATMVPYLRLCSVCFGFVDDARHLGVGPVRTFTGRKVAVSA